MQLIAHITELELSMGLIHFLTGIAVGSVLTFAVVRRLDKAGR